MKTTNTFGISFYLRRYKIKDGKVPIYVRITVDGKRTDLALNPTCSFFYKMTKKSGKKADFSQEKRVVF